MGYHTVSSGQYESANAISKDSVTGGNQTVAKTFPESTINAGNRTDGKIPNSCRLCMDWQFGTDREKILPSDSQ